MGCIHRLFTGTAVDTLRITSRKCIFENLNLHYFCLEERPFCKYPSRRGLFEFADGMGWTGWKEIKKVLYFFVF